MCTYRYTTSLVPRLPPVKKNTEYFSSALAGVGEGVIVISAGV